MVWVRDISFKEKNLKMKVIRRWVLCAGFLMTGLLAGSAVSGSEIAAFPCLISSLQAETRLDFCGSTVPMQHHEVRERFEKELLLALWDRPQVILWLKRSRRYLPLIEQLLKENGLPDDLKYIAVAESAMLPHAGPRRGAVGFWQFMAETGRRYGLRIDVYKDERRNLFASTTAAIRYFKELYQRFGSWELVAAAYNMGEEGVTAEMLEQDTNDYYKLYLPLETQRYLFRVLSAKLILSHPEKFGFQMTAEDYYPPLLCDQVRVDCSQEIPVRIIAQAANIFFKEIKDLNPEIRGHYLPEGSHTVLIPKGAAKGFSDRFTDLAGKYLTAKKEKVYVVQKGDNLSLIAQKFDVPLAALIIWNRIDLKQPIHPGQRLVVWAEEVRTNGMENLESEDPSGR